MKFPQLHDPKWLSLRVDSNVDNIQIAKEIGCSPAAVCKALKNYGLVSRRAAQLDLLNDKEWLNRVYTEEGRNASQVAEFVKCANSAVLDALRRHGIPIKNLAESQRARTSNHGSPNPRPRKEFLNTIQDKGWLSTRIAEGNSMSDIARLAKCSPASVQWALEKFEIEIVQEPVSHQTIDPAKYQRRKETNITLNSHYHHARRITPGGPCVVCQRPGYDVNHKDRDPSNNVPENLERLCRKCHRRHHAAEHVVMEAELRALGFDFKVIYEKGRAALLAGIETPMESEEL